MRDAKRTDGDSVSPRQAAERLTDLAYGLTAGGPLELTVNHERRSVPLGDELRLHRALTVDGERVHLDLRLSWSAHPPRRRHDGTRTTTSSRTPGPGSPAIPASTGAAQSGPRRVRAPIVQTRDDHSPTRHRGLIT
jgi:hypothetical protein